MKKLFIEDVKKTLIFNTLSIGLYYLKMLNIIYYIIVSKNV